MGEVIGKKARVLQVIEAFGPMTSEEFAEECGIAINYARAYISYCKTRKLIYVLKYKRESEVGNGAYPRAVYAIGNLPDAKKPKKMSVRETNKRHRDKKRRLVGMASIFTAGIPVDNLRLTTRKRPDVSEKLKKKYADRANQRAAL